MMEQLTDIEKVQGYQIDAPISTVDSIMIIQEDSSSSDPLSDSSSNSSGDSSYIFSGFCPFGLYPYTSCIMQAAMLLETHSKCD